MVGLHKRRTAISPCAIEAVAPGTTNVPINTSQRPACQAAQRLGSAIPIHHNRKGGHARPPSSPEACRGRLCSLSDENRFREADCRASWPSANRPRRPTRCSRCSPWRNSFHRIGDLLWMCSRLRIELRIVLRPLPAATYKRSDSQDHCQTHHQHTAHKTPP